MQNINLLQQVNISNSTLIKKKLNCSTKFRSSALNYTKKGFIMKNLSKIVKNFFSNKASIKYKYAINQNDYFN